MNKASSIDGLRALERQRNVDRPCRCLAGFWLTCVTRDGEQLLVRIFIGENDKWRDKPLHKALIESMRANDIAGVTVYQGILGYGANRRIHKETTLNLSHDRPMMLSVVDAEEKLRSYFPILDGMVQQGLVVLSDVDVIKYTHKYQEEESGKEARQ